MEPDRSFQEKRCGGFRKIPRLEGSTRLGNSCSPQGKVATPKGGWIGNGRGKERELERRFHLMFSSKVKHKTPKTGPSSTKSSSRFLRHTYAHGLAFADVPQWLCNLHRKKCFELLLDFKFYQLAKEIKPMLRCSVFLWHLFHCISRKCKRK